MNFDLELREIPIRNERMEKQYNLKVFRNFSGKIIYKKDNSYFLTIMEGFQFSLDCVTGIVGNVDWVARFRTFFQFSYSGKLPVRRRIYEKSTHELLLCLVKWGINITFHRLRSVFLFNYINHSLPLRSITSQIKWRGQINTH